MACGAPLARRAAARWRRIGCEKGWQSYRADYAHSETHVVDHDRHSAGCVRRHTWWISHHHEKQPVAPVSESFAKSFVSAVAEQPKEPGLTTNGITLRPFLYAENSDSTTRTETLQR